MASRPVASSVPATSPQLNFRRAVEEEIEDPVSGDLMTKAVTIFPCGHVFNEATIIQCLAHNKLCPLDRKPIEKFTPNTAIRNLADKAIAQPVDEGPSEEAESHFQKGKAFSDQWNYEAAVESFLKALELSPTYEKAQAFLDFCLQRSSTSPSLSEPPISPTSPSREEKQVFSQSPENSKESYVDLLLSLIGKSSVQENASLKAMLVRQLEELMSHADHELSQKESELFRWAKKLFIDEKVSQFVADKLIQIGGGKEKKELEVPSALPSSIPSPAAEERTTFSPVAPDDLAPNPALKETIESYQAQGSQAIQRGVDEKNVPQPHGQDQNDALAKPLLVGAQDLEEKKQFADAEKLYLLALQFTSKSKDYAHLPRLFEKKGEKERAASAYVVLADLQLKEDKAAAAIDTLKEFLKLAPHPAIKEKLGNVFNNHGQKQVAAILFLELAQQAIYNKDTLSAMRLCRLALEAFPGYAVTWRTMAACSTESLETVKVLLKGANESSMPIKERIGLCKMVLIKEPEHLQAKLLFLELNQLNERLSPAPIRSIGMAEWAAPHLIKNLPPYPQELKDFLAGDCTIWSGKKRLETHIVVPLFKHITTVFNGFPVQVPRTLKTLDELDKTSGGVGFKHIWDNISETDQNRPAGEFHYAVLTKDVLPGSRSKPYDFQKQLVESKGYKVPPLLDATTAILWEHQRTGACLFGDNPSTYTRCREEMDFFQLTVGGFVPGGMWVGGLWVHPGRNCGDDVSVGIAGFLEFGAVPPPSSPNPAIGSTSPPPQLAPLSSPPLPSSPSPVKAAAISPHPAPISSSPTPFPPLSSPSIAPVKSTLEPAITPISEMADKAEWEIYKAEADQGNAINQFYVGGSYLLGLGVEKDEAMAVHYYRLAADQGHATAQYNLGVSYAKGTGVKKDEALAVKYYKLAADQGRTEAQCNLGVCYANGKGVQKDEAMAVKYYKLAADQGRTEAQCNLGVCYAKGTGVKKDKALAVKYFQLAADQGDVDAQYNLGKCYAEGEGVNKDEAMAVKYYKLAAEQGNEDAQIALKRLGKEFGDSTDVAVALTPPSSPQLAPLSSPLLPSFPSPLDLPAPISSSPTPFPPLSSPSIAPVKSTLEPAITPISEMAGKAEWEIYKAEAGQGNAEAQYNLGKSYENGTIVKKDDAMAVHYYQLAANQGHAQAQYKLGRCYAKGIGVEKDEAMSAHYYRLAADQGDAIAQYNVGLYYSIGRGVEKDEAMAVKYYKLAADQGDVDAQFILGNYYAEGRGVEKDDTMAMDYYQLAVAQGKAEALEKLGDLCYKRKDFERAYDWYAHATDKGIEGAGYKAGAALRRYEEYLISQFHSQ